MSQHRYFALLLMLTGFTFFAKAQLVVSGKVFDAGTKEPLINASVFCENTTILTITDKNGNFSLSLNPGGYTVIVSYIGYKTQNLQVTSSTENLEFLLIKDIKPLKEVVLVTKSKLVEDGWNSYGSYFIKNFIGSTPNAANCYLLNPEVLKFYYYSDRNRLKVIATAPLNISNKALGYTLSYRLDSFIYYFDEAVYSYKGNCLFSEMQGTDSEKKAWKYNRKNAYKGSILHFMRSYYNGSLRTDEWSLSMAEKNDATTFDRIANPFDSTFFVRLSQARQIAIHFPRTIKITYLKKIPEPEYLEKYGLPANSKTVFSLIDAKEDIVIKENGFYYDQMKWTSFYYWGWQNVADQLPYDYMP